MWSSGIKKKRKFGINPRKAGCLSQPRRPWEGDGGGYPTPRISRNLSDVAKIVREVNQCSFRAPSVDVLAFLSVVYLLDIIYPLAYIANVLAGLLASWADFLLFHETVGEEYLHLRFSQKAHVRIVALIHADCSNVHLVENVPRCCRCIVNTCVSLRQRLKEIFHLQHWVWTDITGL